MATEDPVVAVDASESKSDSPTRLLVAGTGPVAADVAARAAANGLPVHSVPAAGSDAPLTADAVLAALPDHDSVVLCDEFADVLSAEEVGAIGKAAADAGVRVVVRVSYVGANGGGWFRHRFGTADILDRHSAADDALDKSGAAFGIVYGGVLHQTLSAFYGPVCKATKSFPDPLGGARMSYVDASDVGEAALLMATDGVPGKTRITINGSRGVQCESIATFLSMQLEGDRAVPSAAVPLEEFQALLQEHAGVSDARAAAFCNLLAMGQKGAFDSNSADVPTILKRPEVGIDTFLKSAVADFV